MICVLWPVFSVPCNCLHLKRNEAKHRFVAPPASATFLGIILLKILWKGSLVHDSEACIFFYSSELLFSRGLEGLAIFCHSLNNLCSSTAYARDLHGNLKGI